MSDYKIVKIFDESNIVEEEIETPINTFKVGNVIKLKDDVKDIKNRPLSKDLFERVLLVADIRGAEKEILVLSACKNGPRLGMIHFTNAEFVADEMDMTIDPSITRFPKYICDITVNEAAVRSKPTGLAPVIKKVHKYDLFTIVDEKDGWAKLKVGGWIKLEDIRKVKTL